MNTFRKIQSLCALVVAGAALVCGNAAFAAANDPPQRSVRWDDLNLDKQAGVATLYRRIASAAKVVCAPAISVPITLRSNSRACVRLTIADAVSRVNNESLTAYHDARTATATDGTKVASSR